MKKRLSVMLSVLLLLNLFAMSMPLSVFADEPSVSAASPEYYSLNAAADRHLIDFSQSNVVDWLHFSGTSPNRKAGVAGDRLTFNGTYTKQRDPTSDWLNSAISYTDGTNPVSVNNSGAALLYTGLNSSGVFTAPSKAGVERKLEIYMGSWAGKTVEVTAVMGGISVPVENFTTGKQQTLLAKYTFTYTGAPEEHPLTVTLTLTDNAFDPNWANLAFSGARITEGEPEPPKPTVRFSGAALIGANAVKIPPSGRVRRDFAAELYDVNGVPVNGAEFDYSLKAPCEGVSLDGNVLSVTGGVPGDVTVTVIAASRDNPEVTGEAQVQIVKDESLQDFPANGIDKQGYVLYHSSEFDEAPDARYWSEHYLRSWGTDEDSKSHYFIEDGNLVLTAPRDIADAWSAQDRNHRVSGIMSFERQHLHRFGAAAESREIPAFDGLATKYGYFEVRLKMPNTRDGSHFAWWMVGTQDDQHPTVSLASNPNELYPSDGMGWGVEDYYWSHQGAEYDIIEQHLDPAKAGAANYDTWLPVMHKNGTRDYQDRWWAGLDVPAAERFRYSQNGADPYNEFHIYALEWDENGARYYFDNELVYTSDHTAGYRMMTIFSLYAGRSIPENGDFGWDRGVYPKDVTIDYFRIYKKDEAPAPYSVVLNGYNTPYYFPVPQEGSVEIPMSADVLDQFDKPIGLTGGQKLKWCFAGDIGGTEGRTTALDGVSINADTGVVTVEAGAPLTQDLFLTAYVEGGDIPAARRVYETRHVKLSADAPQARLVVFGSSPDTVSPGAVVDLSAVVYDQYMQPADIGISYRLSSDITGKTPAEIPGVSVSADGKLSVASDVPAGTTIIVTADSGLRYTLNGSFLRAEDAIMQNAVLRVSGEPVTAVNKDALVAAMAECESLGLKSVNYTADSWQAYSAAYGHAVEIWQAKNAAQQQVDAAAAGLASARAALVRKLDVMLAEYTALTNDGRYTTAAWQAFQEAIAAAQAVAGSAASTQDDITDAQEQLLKARLSLVNASDKTALRTLVSIVAAADLSGCTEASRTAIASALAHAEYILGLPDADQTAVNDAWQALQEAFMARKDLAELEDLAALVALLKTLSEEDFTPNSWAAMNAELAAAESVLASSEPAQETVNAAYESLFEAANNLVLRANFGALEEAVRAAEKILENPAAYRPSSLAGLQEALAEAKTVLEDKNNSTEAVNSAAAALSEALGKVRERANTLGLRMALAAVQSLAPGNYTAASFSALSAATAGARELLDNPEAEQEAVDAKTELVNQAIANLVSKPVVPPAPTPTPQQPVVTRPAGTAQQPGTGARPAPAPGTPQTDGTAEGTGGIGTGQAPDPVPSADGADTGADTPEIVESEQTPATAPDPIAQGDSRWIWWAVAAAVLLGVGVTVIVIKRRKSDEG